MPVAEILPRSIRGRLIVLTAAVVIPAALMAGLLVFEDYHRQRVAVEHRLNETARALAMVVDRQLGRSEALLKGLATSPDLLHGNYAAFHQQAVSAVNQAPNWVILTGRSGYQLVNTYASADTPLPATEAHPDVLEALRRGETVVSNLRQSSVRAGPVLSVAVPVFVNAEPAYVLELVMPPSALSDILIEPQLPEGWVAAIIDRAGMIAARGGGPQQFIGAKVPADLLKRLEGQVGLLGGVTVDGQETLAAFSRSPKSDWTVVIGAPRDFLLAPVLQLLLLSFAVVFTLVAVGLVTSIWLARGIVRSVDALVTAAHAIGRGETPGPITTGMLETDQVARALHVSALRLNAREAELKQLNETLEDRVTAATETLVQARKLEAVGLLTGGVAHDFNNLLTAIGVSLDLLARKVSDPKLAVFIRAAREATDRGAKLTAQLLAFARKQRLQPEPVDVNAVVLAMGELMSSTLGGSVRIETELAPNLEPAFADRTQLELILMNLAINARDAMETGGVVRIRTDRTMVTEGPTRAEHAEPGDYIRVSVSDTGPGIPPEVRARIFEPFFTTKPTGKGSGLGLPQVMGVVKQLGGGVRIDSEPGQGATVSILLPIAGEALRADAIAEAVDADALKKLAGLTVLLVDDDQSVRIATTALLEEMGCRVVAADGAAAALERLAGVDLALIDYAMPEMNGAELAARLTRMRPELPVLLMSGYVNADARAGSWTGKVLQKPFSKESLTRRLAEQLRVS